MSSRTQTYTYFALGTAGAAEVLFNNGSLLPTEGAILGAGAGGALAYLTDPSYKKTVAGTIFALTLPLLPSALRLGYRLAQGESIDSLTTHAIGGILLAAATNTGLARLCNEYIQQRTKM